MSRVLDLVRVLELVDEDVVELLLERFLRRDDLDADRAVGRRLEDADDAEDEVLEVEGVGGAQGVLVASRKPSGCASSM